VIPSLEAAAIALAAPTWMPEAAEVAMVTASPRHLRRGDRQRSPAGDGSNAGRILVVGDTGEQAAEFTGATWVQAIAGALNARGVRTARGGTWHASTARNIVNRVGVSVTYEFGAGYAGRVFPPTPGRAGARFRPVMPGVVPAADRPGAASPAAGVAASPALSVMPGNSRHSSIAASPVRT
jgi:hypothetical protein